MTCSLVGKTMRNPRKRKIKVATQDGQIMEMQYKLTYNGFAQRGIENDEGFWIQLTDKMRIQFKKQTPIYR